MLWLPLLVFVVGVGIVPSFVVWIVVAVVVSCLVNDDTFCWMGLLIVLIEKRQLQMMLCLDIVVYVAVADNFAGNIDHCTFHHLMEHCVENTPTDALSL